MATFFDLVIEEFELELEIAILELEDEILEFENNDIRTLNNPVQCHKCAKVFSSVPILNFHIKLNHVDNSKIESDEENVYFRKNPTQCVICHKTFPNTTTLELHTNISHETIKSGTKIPTKEYNRVFKKKHSESHGEILGCERSLNKSCSIKNDKDFRDEPLACEGRHLRTHIMIISSHLSSHLRIISSQDFKIPKRIRRNISSKNEDQNFTFQVF